MSESPIGKRSAQRDAAERRNQNWPGRVTRPGLSVLCLAFCACVASTTPSIPPGYTLRDPDTGVAILRVEYVDGHGKPHPHVQGPLLPNRLPPVTWTKWGSSGESYEVGPVSDGSASDFYAALPAGRYRMICNTEVGEVCEFAIEPGVVVYVGVLRVRGKQTVPYDEYEAARERFSARHPELAIKVKKSLLRTYVYHPGALVGTPTQPYLEERPWEGPAHRNPPY